MKPEYVKVNSSNQTGVNIRKDKLPYFPKIWHFHQELEIVLILKSTGTRFIGDSIEEFSEGDLVMVGSNLPHSWQNDKKFFNTRDKDWVEAIIIHFKEDFLGTKFTHLVGMKHLQDLFDRAKLGIKFTRETSEKIEKGLNKLQKLSGFNRIIEFLKILHLLAGEKDYKLLANIGFVESYNKMNSSKIDIIYEYIINNITEDISLTDVAAIANMNASAFSRFFKSKTKKNFTIFLNETRIGFACKMLMENELNISQIAYECGYQSLSNFNKQFKKINGITPKDFKKQY